MTDNKTIQISRKAKRVSLQRYLWSKIAYGDQVGFRELGGLVLNQLWLENKSQTDAEFQKKFQEILEISGKILKELNLSQGFSDQALKRLRSRTTTELEAFLVPKRNYGQWKNRFDNLVSLTTPKSLGVPAKNLPPKKFIGKGYGDKGTAKNPAVDASPSWQEVAQSNLAKKKNKLRRMIDENRQIRSPLERVRHLRKISELKQEIEKETSS